MADAGDLYLSWYWAGEVDAPGVAVIPEDQVAAAVARFAAALPRPEVPGGLEAAFTTGELATFDAENELAQYLSRVFLPFRLAEQLYRLWTGGVRPYVRIQPSPRVARIPWELLAPDPELRLLDIADVGTLAPAGLVHAPGRVARSWSADRALPVVAVLDPRVPGFRADSALGSVLGRMDGQAPLARRVAEYGDRLAPAVTDPVDAFRRTDVDRDWLGRALRAGAARLLYVGHVTAATPESGRSEEARLHLACTDATTGFAPIDRIHRPLSAKDLILGTHAAAADPVDGATRWPIPARVALIACESGGDLRFGEALGLLAAMIHGGAELVTASRWTLPTDLAFQRFGAAGSGTRPLQDAVCAIDAAHERPDPVEALLRWQRERLAAWRDTRQVVDSPLLWAAFATVDTHQCSS
ncbi:CHAT domain-containing protein [Nocardia aurantia]|nr:CHAT domain-containing protein [Nocardia aurantia]